MRKLLYVILIITIFFITGVFVIFSKPTQKKEDIVFWTLQMSDFEPYINGVISEYESLNPNVKIKWVDVPFSEGEKRTLASVLSDNPPDLVNLNPDFSATLAHKGALYEIPNAKLEQFNEEIVNSLKYNGKLYSIPWYTTSAITIYNKELLSKAGIEVPKSFSDIEKVASDVKLKTGAYVFLPNITENDVMLKILNKYGVASSTLLNSKKSVAIFEMFKQLYKKGLIPSETVTVTFQESLEKYMSEKVLLITAGANFLNMIRENAPSIYEKTDVSSQIVGEFGQYDFSLMNFVIPVRAKHKEEALDFALFLTNDKNQLELAKLTNVIAVNKETLKNEFYTKYNEKDLEAKARVISAKQLNKLDPIYKTSKGQKDINTIVNTAVQEILLDKDSPQVILDKAAKTWVNIEE